MPYAIGLFLDEPADRRVRQLRTALDAQGIRSLGAIPDSAFASAHRGV